MGWYGRESITKYYSIGFTEKELQEIEAAYKEAKVGRFYLSKYAYFRKRTNFIRYLALSYIDLEKENQQLKKAIRETQEQPEAMGQVETSEATTWTGVLQRRKKQREYFIPGMGVKYERHDPIAESNRRHKLGYKDIQQ